MNWNEWGSVQWKNILDLRMAFATHCTSLKVGYGSITWSVQELCQIRFDKMILSTQWSLALGGIVKCTSLKCFTMEFAIYWRTTEQELMNRYMRMQDRKNMEQHTCLGLFRLKIWCTIKRSNLIRREWSTWYQSIGYWIIISAQTMSFTWLNSIVPL